MSNSNYVQQLNELAKKNPGLLDFIFRLYWYPRITDLEFIDADTVRLWMGLGFHMDANALIFRVDHLNAPEITGAEKPLGVAATEAVKAFVEGGQLIAQTIRTKKDFDAQGKYGRWRVVLYLLKDNKLWNVNEWLIENGYAVRKEY